LTNTLLLQEIERGKMRDGIVEASGVDVAWDRRSGYPLNGAASIGYARYPQEGATKDILLSSGAIYLIKNSKRQVENGLGWSHCLSREYVTRDTKHIWATVVRHNSVLMRYQQLPSFNS